VKTFQWLKDAPIFGSSTDETMENDCYQAYDVNNRMVKESKFYACLNNYLKYNGEYQASNVILNDEGT